MKAATIPKPILYRHRHKFQCFACNKTVEISADAVMDAWIVCPTPGCGHVLLIRWSAITKVPA